MLDFKSAFQAVGKLITTFEASEEFFLSPGFDESSTRQTFIDWFFVAFGWDVYLQQQRNPYEWEVRIENKSVRSPRCRRSAARRAKDLS